MVARLGGNHRDENLFDRHPHRQFGIGLLDEFGIQRLALHRIDLGGGIVDQLVDRRIGPVPLIGPRRALRLPERYHTVVETAGSLRYWCQPVAMSKA